MARTGSLRSLVNRAKSRIGQAKAKATATALASSMQKSKLHVSLSLLDAELQRPGVYTTRQRVLIAHNRQNPRDRLATARDLTKQVVKDSKKLQRLEGKRARAEASFEASQEKLARAKRLRGSRIGKTIRIATGGPRLWRKIKNKK